MVVHILFLEHQFINYDSHYNNTFFNAPIDKYLYIYVDKMSSHMIYGNN